MPFFLGRNPHDPERLARGLMAAPAPMPYLPLLDRSAIDPQPSTWDNDQTPDCTTAGLANSLTAQGVILSAPPIIAANKPLSLYATIKGMPGATEQQLAATDGAVMMDVLDYVETNGFDVGGQVPMVPVQRFVIHNAREAIAGVMCDKKTTVGYLGIRLYARDMDVIGQGPWTAKIADSGDLVGGHCLLSWDYAKGLSDNDLLSLLTWGIKQPASWAWLMERLDESHGLEWPQLALAAIA